MARRTWESLSPKYRQRLTRNGVTPEQYVSGTGTLAKARGHQSTAKENARAKFLRSRQKYVKMTAKMLGRDEDEQHEHFMLYTEAEQNQMMEAQEEAFTLYRSGDHDGASQVFNELQSHIGYLPYWLTPYHGKKF